MKSDAQAAKPRQRQDRDHESPDTNHRAAPQAPRNGGADCAPRSGGEVRVRPGEPTSGAAPVTLSADRSARGPAALPAGGREAGVPSSGLDRQARRARARRFWGRPGSVAMAGRVAQSQPNLPRKARRAPARHCTSKAAEHAATATTSRDHQEPPRRPRARGARAGIRPERDEAESTNGECMAVQCACVDRHCRFLPALVHPLKERTARIEARGAPSRPTTPRKSATPTCCGISPRLRPSIPPGWSTRAARASSSLFSMGHT